MQRTVILVLIGLAIASLAALAWRIHRPIDVPDAEPTSAAERVARRASPPSPSLPPEPTRGQAPPSLSTPPDAPARRGFRDLPAGQREALSGVKPMRLGRFGEGRLPGLGHADPAISLQMDEANQYFERGQFADAKEQALRVLSIAPAHPRMLRVVVGSACMTGDAETARAHFDLIARPRDREQMLLRCRQAGIELAP